ncbi:MAG: hypothetical protein QW063_01525 [Candidatus Nanoarchaeia archaeon]
MELKLIENLMQGPLTTLIAAVVTFTTLALKGKDVRRLISKLVDDAVPAIA